MTLPKIIQGPTESRYFIKLPDKGCWVKSIAKTEEQGGYAFQVTPTMRKARSWKTAQAAQNSLKKIQSLYAPAMSVRCVQIAQGDA